MKLSINGNANYTATVTTIKNVIPLENCDAIQHTIVFGNYVIVSKDVQPGDIGIFFPVEAKLSDLFLSSNNLYRNKELNADKTKAGFFDDNKRIRCIRMRGNRSEGLFMPLTSLFAFISDVKTLHALEEGSSFDTIEGVTLCEKYVVYNKHSGTGTKKNEKKGKAKFSKLLPNIFRFHINTPQLGKLIHVLKEEDIISVTEKIHGSSFIVSNLLCKRKLNWYEKALKKVGVKISHTQFDNLYASRKILKNSDLCTNPSGYYSTDIWGIVNEELKSYLTEGMTIYGEVCGYLPDGGGIQKSFDYGCNKNEHKNYIYRITTTDSKGNCFEWSMLQIQQWCKQNNLNAVPLHYYGTVGNLFTELYHKYEIEDMIEDKKFNSDLFLDLLSKEYLEKKCSICQNDVPNEGVVIRRESLDIEVYKHKSNLFRELETKNLDKGETNIEDNQEG